MVRCFLCSWSGGRDTEDTLYMHVWDRHLRDMNYRSKFCWCGANFSSSYISPSGFEAFIGHCEWYEGLWAHYLVSQLSSEVPT